MTTVEEDKDKAKTIAAIDVEDTNDGAGNPDANKDGGDSDGDGNGNGNSVNACERIGMHTLDASGHGRDPLEGGGGSQLYLN